MKLQVPDPQNLSFVQQICDIDQPFLSSRETEAAFVAAMREIAGWHARGSKFYNDLLRDRRFDLESLREPQDLLKLPIIPATFFKTHEVLSVAREQIVMHFTSSGTTGQKSQMFFDDWSLRSGQRMVDFTFSSFGWRQPETPHNYLLYTYETEPDSKLGTAYTDNYLCKFAPLKKGFFAIRRTGSGHDFDVFGCIQKLQEYADEALPVRIFGFPSFLYFTIKRMRDLGFAKVQLAKESLVILGGGWKGHADQAIPKEELYALVEEWLGVPRDRVRDSFGAVEHGVPYTECARHQFHVPVWSQVVIRDVRQLSPLPFGAKGFLQFLTPFITSVPAHSLMMGDLASLYPGSECGCGIRTPYFVVHGRAGTSKNRSCAVAASELFGRA